MKPLPPLPDSVIETCRQLYGSAESTQWILGDYLVEIMDELAQHYAALLGGSSAHKYHKARAHIIRQLAQGVGADTSTLRDRECMARFFPVPVRSEYQALTWSQLRAVKSAGSEWEQYAERAINNLPAPVSVIREWIRKDHNGEPAWIDRWDRLVNLVGVLSADTEAPDWVRAVCTAIDEML